MAFGADLGPSRSKDSDNDGVDDKTEAELGLDLSNPDTDGDGALDGEEVVRTGTKTTIHEGGLLDPDEYPIHEPLYTQRTNPLDPDSDGDYLLDGEELDAGTNAWDADTDGDKLFDGDEVHRYGSDPTKQDTDGAEGDDFTEVQEGSNPAKVATEASATGLATANNGGIDALNDPLTPATWADATGLATGNNGGIDALNAPLRRLGEPAPSTTGSTTDEPKATEGLGTPAPDTPTNTESTGETAGGTGPDGATTNNESPTTNETDTGPDKGMDTGYGHETYPGSGSGAGDGFEIDIRFGDGAGEGEDIQIHLTGDGGQPGIEHFTKDVFSRANGNHDDGVLDNINAAHADEVGHTTEDEKFSDDDQPDYADQQASTQGIRAQDPGQEIDALVT